jgi:hypothetical protein
MKLRWFLLLLFLLPACRPGAQPLSVSGFPEPPQQRAAWAFSTNSISADIVSAAAALFDVGLADPRGCEYREIEIHIGEVWRGDGGTIKTHGWVLPAASNTNQNFAICWNGLVYPVASLGVQANLQTDMEAFINAATTNISRIRMTLYGRAIPEKLSVAADSILPIKTCLLLRIGENDLATKVWNACTASLESSRGQEQAKDPYLMLAGDWAWSLFDRTICAHMRGDVPLALVSARKLAEIQPKIEAEAAKRGFPHPGYNDSAKHETERPYLSFLDQLPQLLTDLERRAHEPKGKSVIEIGITNFPSQSKRIAALIADLDLVNARQWGQPGGVALFSDPIVAVLIQEGDATVEPLLDCMENDKRFTCSVSFGRDFFRDRHVLPVSSAAKSALQQIMHAEFRDGAAEIRAYWKQNKGLKLEDRWYATLQDDRAGAERWAEAAGNITQPENIVGVPGMGYSQVNPTPTNHLVRMRGEPLRGKTNPSVSELMARRAIEVASTRKDYDAFALHIACQIGLCLAVWDIQASGSTAKQLVESCRGAMTSPELQQGSWTVQRLGSFIGKLTIARAQARDNNALQEYAVWLRTMSPDQLETYLPDSLEPLTKFPDDSAIQALAADLFKDTNSSWSKLPWKRTGGYNPVESDLTKVLAFRQLLVRELDKTDVIGSMEYFRPNTISYSLKDFGGGSRGFPWPEAEQPAIGTKVDVRQCDWIAFSLSNAKRIPFFNPFASVEKRDEAIKNAKAALSKSQ